MEQQPIHGRRKTEKDRRPIAHCPILRLRLREVKEIMGEHGSAMEEEELDVGYVTYLVPPLVLLVNGHTCPEDQADL